MLLLLEFIWYIKYTMYQLEEQVRRINVQGTFETGGMDMKEEYVQTPYR